MGEVMDIKIPHTKEIYEAYFYNHRVFRYNARIMKIKNRAQYVNGYYVDAYVIPFIRKHATKILKNHLTNLKKNNIMFY